MAGSLNLRKIKKFFRHRKTGSHKGENGRVLIIGGSDWLTGAPALASMAALACLRSGVDLCTVAAPEKTGWAIQQYAPDLIVKKLRGNKLGTRHLGKLLKLAENKDAVLIGPGMGRDKGTIRLIRLFVKKSGCNLVVDADALRACTGMKMPYRAIATPHSKEFEIFTGRKIADRPIKEKIALVKEAARRQNCTILLKGPVDIISDGNKVLLNRTGNEGMTKGGTGDVLAGMCTGFLALGAGEAEAAGAAAFINGKIGDTLKKKNGYSFIASDFIPQIGHWVKKILA